MKLSHLRDIGWSLWDPIGLLPSGDHWNNHSEFADEYDEYLTEAASRLRRGESVPAVASYLVRVATEQMRLDSSPVSSSRASAEATAAAIKAYLDETPPDL